MCEAGCHAFNPSDSAELLQHVAASAVTGVSKGTRRACAKVMALQPVVLSLRDAYIAVDKRNKPAALGALAKQFSKYQLNKYVFEGTSTKVTDRQMTSARLHSAVWGVAMPPEDLGIHVMMISADVVKDVVSHILDPNWAQKVAVGESNLKLSNGEEVKISNIQRQELRENMWRSFKEETGDNREAEGWKVGRSSYLHAANLATSSQQKSLAALDNVAVRYGFENFKLMRELAAELGAAGGPPAKAHVSGLVARIDKLEVYLKSDFKKHLQRCSKCAMHDTLHMLGGVSTEASHPEHCGQCDSAQVLLSDFEALLQVACAGAGGSGGSARAQLQEDYLYRIKLCKKKLALYMQHQVRAQYEDQTLPLLMGRLKAGALDFLVICDWKMKWLVRADECIGPIL